MFSLTVLAPNGHRRNCKYSPNTTLMQIIEDVCKKYDFDPNNYEIRHHNKVLDMTCALRYSGLPNNAQLELVTSMTRPSDTSTVTLAIQIAATGDRVIRTFPSSTTLWDVIMHDTCRRFVGENPIVIYTRHEIFGPDLYTTTLRNLGLIQGRAMIRLLDQKPDELRTQANVSSIISVPFKKAVSAPPPPPPDVVPMEQDEEEPPPKPPIPEPEPSPIQDAKKVPKFIDLEPPKEIHYIGPRNALLFALSDRSVSNIELPDEFYDLTIDDAKLLLRDVRQRQADLENGPLMTAAMRNLEDAKRQLRQLSRYRKTIIRVQFPNRVVLQGVFAPTETVADIKAFICQFLNEANTPFYLYMTPPKQILDDTDRLIEIGCIPGALLYFGTALALDTANLFKDEFFRQHTTILNANFAAKQIRQQTIRPHQSDEDKDEEWRPPVTPSAHITYELSQPSTSGTQQSVPKWFKR